MTPCLYFMYVKTSEAIYLTYHQILMIIDIPKILDFEYFDHDHPISTSEMMHQTSACKTVLSRYR